MHDTILVRNLQFHAYHGVYEEERAEGRRFAIDVEVDVLPGSAGTSDVLDDTVDYRDVAQVVVDVMRGPSAHLIEHLIDRIAVGLFERLPRVDVVRMEVRKRATGVPGDPEWVGLRVTRRRSG